MPFTAALGLQAAGGFMTALGARDEAKQIQQNYLYNAQIAEKNAELIEMRIADALELGQRQEAAVGRKARAVKGAQATAGASSGLSLSSQSILNVLAGTDVLEAYDIETVRENVKKDVKALEIEREMAYQEAFQQRMAAFATDSGFASSILNTATSVARGWG